VAQVSDFLVQAQDLNLDPIYIHGKVGTHNSKTSDDFADENYIRVKNDPGASLQLEKSLSFSNIGDFLS